jgi:hypothetical protein
MNELSANDYEFSQTFWDGYFALDAPSSAEPNTSSNMCWNDDPSNPANAADARNGADIASDTFHSTYTVKPGDSPASISQHYFGTEKASAAILGTNGKSVSVAGSRGLQVGEVLTLPSANEIDNSALLHLGGALIGADTHMRVRESQAAAQQEAATKATARSKATALDQGFSLSDTNTLPGSFIAGVLSIPATAPTPYRGPKEPYEVPLLTRILGGSAANELRTDLSGSEKAAIRDLHLASNTVIAGTGTVAALAPMALAGTATAGEAALGLYWRNPVLYSTLGSLAGEVGLGFASGAPSPSTLTVLPTYVGGAAFGGGASNFRSFAARAGGALDDGADVLRRAGVPDWKIQLVIPEPGTLSVNPLNVIKLQKYQQETQAQASKWLINSMEADLATNSPNITPKIRELLRTGERNHALDFYYEELVRLESNSVNIIINFSEYDGITRPIIRGDKIIEPGYLIQAKNSWAAVKKPDIFIKHNEAQIQRTRDLADQFGFGWKYYFSNGAHPKVVASIEEAGGTFIAGLKNSSVYPGPTDWLLQMTEK